MNDALLDRIRPVTRRLRSVRFWRCVAAIALVAGIAGWLMKREVDAGQISGPAIAIVLSASVVIVGLLAALITRFSFRNPREVAKHIESQFPNLDQRLLTALSQRDDQLGYLQQRVVREARDHSRSHRWSDTVPSARLFWSRLSGFGATAFFAVVVAVLALTNPTVETSVASRIEKSAEVKIIPGNTEVERGTSLVVTARFDGWVPDVADLICEAADGSERRITMTQNLDDPVVGGFISSVDQAFAYRVATPDWQSDVYQVDVFEFPSLVRSDANLDYPEYTGLTEKRVEDTVRVSAVEGTEVTWICFLNKPVASAELVAKDGTRIKLEEDPDWPGAMSTKLKLTETQRLKLELVDDVGRENKYPPELVARVLPNQPPSLKLTAGGDVSVSPLEELPLAAEVRDDFGVSKMGVSFTFAMEPPKEITLAEGIPRGARTSVEHMIEFEELEAEPDQLLAYHFWAEDYGPEGDLRRTDSDMFFAEVRPFEEIFREGEQPPGGQQQQQQQGNQNGQEAEQLAELQKEIINATWRVIRQERYKKERSDKFDENVALLDESQTQALAQLEELSTNLRDEQSLKYVDEVRDQMQQALIHLTKADTDSAVLPLNSAIVSEQGAYGGLLKLRAREFQITRQQRQRNQSRGSQQQRRRQRQLDELELDQDENRYETQQQAQEESAEEQEQRETRQVLNRLRELARRQEDLNKELAQLQSALEQAETEEEKEEIERQLKRLREQQQDLLRETDELNERMQQPENQERMAEASEQLDETRENLRKASEALENKDAATALSAGRRAERELEEMRDEFRQQAAGQFNDAVRQMRNEAQELDQQQEQLAQDLRDMNKPEEKAGLRGSTNRQKIQEDLESQREQLGELLDQMKETVEQAETAEPLLAQKLYDSYRKTQQRQVDRQLDNTAELLRRGFDPQARETERGASEGIDQLRQDLEEAASSVLGDETKALERALSELERLERALNDEIRENNPQAREQQDAQGQQQGQSQQGEQSQDQQQQGRGQRQGEQQDDQQRQDQQQGQGQRSQEQQQDDQQQQGQQGQQPSEQQGQGQGQREQQSEQQQQQQQGRGQGQQQSEQRSEQQGQSQQQQGQAQNRQGGRQQRQQGGNQNGGREDRIGGLLNRFAADSPEAAPLTGDGFRDWTDRLRDVEEMVDDPELRSQAARIRDRARDVRVDVRRHSKTPQWDLVEKMIAEPLRELRVQVSEELLRRSAERHAPVPIDRDPVPVEYADAVQKYYESLGSGR